MILEFKKFKKFIDGLENRTLKNHLAEEV